MSTHLVCRLLFSLIVIGVSAVAGSFTSTASTVAVMEDLPAIFALEKVSEAEQIASGIDLRSRVKVVKGRIMWRPVALVAWSAREKKWRVVHAQIPSKYTKAPTVQTDTPGCLVHHLEGYGPVRFSVRVICGAEELTVYRTKHVVFSNNALPYRKNGAREALRYMTEEDYTAFYDKLYSEELVKNGTQFLFEKIRVAKQQLEMGQVHSLANSTWKLAESVPWELLLALAVIEQSDDKKFRESPRRTIDSILIHFALNREEAFGLSRSRANALGAFQFTDKRGNGTYSLVVRACKGAALNPDFEAGARDLVNIIKAAICLIDIEIAEFPEILGAYAKNPLRAGMYAIAAYNGGNYAGRSFHCWRMKTQIDILKLAPNDLPTKFCGKYAETTGYLWKYLYIINKELDRITTYVTDVA